MTPSLGLNNPNLGGLNLPLPLTDAIRQIVFAIQALQSQSANASTAAAALTVVDTTLTASGTTFTPPAGAGDILAYVVRQDATGGRTFSFDSRAFLATGSTISTIASTISTFIFVKTGTLYVQAAAFTTDMATGVTNLPPQLLGRGQMIIDPGAAPQNSQILLQSNALGALAAMSLGADNNQVLFDAFRSSGSLIAANATMSRIAKNAAKLSLGYANGLVVGNPVGAVSTGFALNLATGNIIVTLLTESYNGAATAGMGLPPIYGVQDLTGKTAAVPAANLYGPGGNAPAGIYCVAAQEVITTAGNNINVTAQVTYSDPNAGALTDNIVSVNPNAGAGTHLGSVTTFKHDGTTQIQYQTTLTGAIGAGVYSVRFVLYRMS